MIALRHFSIEDLDVIADHLFPGIDHKTAINMLEEWNTCSFDGKYFEMFAVEEDNKVVGYVSIHERSERAVSIGVEILEEERLKGYATRAMKKIMTIAKKKGYRIVIDQVETSNEASKALHTALGFETDGYIFKNQRERSVLLFIKIID